MASEDTYPDPSSEQVKAGSGPFFNSQQDPSNILSELSARYPDPSTRRRDGEHMHPANENYNAPNQHYNDRAETQNGPHSHDPSDTNNFAAAENLDTSQREAMQGGSSIAEDALRAAHQSQQENYMMSFENADPAPAGTPPAESQGDLPPRAKRNKVSRACDECRRKKIRCDASETEPHPTCSNCRRTNAPCQFSRTPMKRGPSKGYIKELADKINTLESRLGPPAFGNHTPQQQVEQGYPAQYSQAYDSGINGAEAGRGEYTVSNAQIGRKRSHSMSERDGSNGTSGQHINETPFRPHQPYVQQDPRQLPPLASSLGPPHTSTMNSHSRSHVSPRDPWRYPGKSRRDNLGVPYNEDREAAATVLHDWDESIIDEYYHIFHQTFPLLPHSKHRLRLRLINCPVSLRDAFFVALDCCIRSSPHSNTAAGFDLAQRTKHAAELVAASQYENAATRTLSSDLIYIQILIIMALETDNHGPATMRRQGGPPRAEWLGRAIGVATYLKLNQIAVGITPDGGDPDSDERLGRRAWWILFILDRWHACSTSSLHQLPEKGASIHHEDQLLLGEGTYHLARLSDTLGHLNLVLHSPPDLMSPNSTSGPLISTTILGEIARFRESVESLLLGSPNLVHLCYYHVRLLVHRLTASSQHYDLHELLLPAVRMSRILNQRATGITPLNHHFAALAALTLCELVEFEECRDEVREGLTELRDAIGGRKGLMAHEDSQGWDSAIRARVEAGLRRVQELEDREREHQAQQTDGHNLGLQHLAEVADKQAKNRERDRARSSEARRDFDPTALTRYGYLAALVKEDGR